MHSYQHLVHVPWSGVMACVPQWPPELYQWESCTTGRSNQAGQDCGVEARLRASVTPRAISVGILYYRQIQPSWTGLWGRGQTVCLSDPQSYVRRSLVLLAGPTKLNRSVGYRPDCVPQWPPELRPQESCTPGRSNQAEQVCGVQARLCASVTPRAISVGVLYSWQA